MNVYKERLERIARIAHLKVTFYNNQVEEELTGDMLTKLLIWKQVESYCIGKSLDQLDDIITVWGVSNEDLQ